MVHVNKPIQNIYVISCFEFFKKPGNIMQVNTKCGDYC